MKRYERLASQVGDLIRRGDLLPGTRITIPLCRWTARAARTAGIPSRA